MEAFRKIYERSPATIEIPSGLRNRRIEIIILPLGEDTPQANTAATTETDANGYPIGYFDETFGSLPELERAPQGAYDVREELQ